MGDHLVTDLAPRFAGLGMLRSDILVANFAVWTNSAAELERNLTLWADFYARHRAALPFVIWRDASVQHFDTPTGARGRPDLATSPALCLPSANSSLRKFMAVKGVILASHPALVACYYSVRTSCDVAEKGAPCWRAMLVCTCGLSRMPCRRLQVRRLPGRPAAAEREGLQVPAHGGGFA